MIGGADRVLGAAHGAAFREVRRRKLEELCLSA